MLNLNPSIAELEQAIEILKAHNLLPNEYSIEDFYPSKPVLEIGTKLYGYCNGFFHADYYSGYKTVVAFGENWIVALEEDGYPNFAYFDEGWVNSRDEMIKKWKKKPDEQAS